MCLDIHNTLRPRRPLTVYKIYQRKQGDGEENPKQVKTCFQCEDVTLHKGRFVKSNREYTTLSEYEDTEKEITFGLHAFTSRNVAFKNAEGYNLIDNPHFVVEMIGYPEDFVARGAFNRKESIVFTKLKVKKVHRAPKVVANS